MKIISPNAEVSLRAVRELSERATLRPYERKLLCIPVQRTAHDALAARARVFHPWRMTSSWGLAD